MARVLTAISRDSPSAPVSASVNDTFSFAGTPTLTGGGGVQRYDFRWEVDEGSGYVPISGSTGLTTANTNPLTNTNSQSQNAITVTCAQVGSYTIRMAGAPSTGGNYTVFSPTQTVEVALAGIAGTLAAVESGADTASASGTVEVSGSLSTQESGADSFSGTGSVQSNEITGSLVATEAGPDAFSGSGAVPIAGSFAATESGADGFSGGGSVAVSGSLGALEAANDNFAGAGSIAVSGLLSATETGTDDFTGYGQEPQVHGRKPRQPLRAGLGRLGRL